MKVVFIYRWILHSTTSALLSLESLISCMVAVMKDVWYPGINEFCLGTFWWVFSRTHVAALSCIVARSVSSGARGMCSFVTHRQLARSSRTSQATKCLRSRDAIPESASVLKNNAPCSVLVILWCIESKKNLPNSYSICLGRATSRCIWV